MHLTRMNLMASRTRGGSLRKKVVHLRVDGEIIDAARSMKLNLSQVFEAGLTEAIHQKERKA